MRAATGRGRERDPRPGAGSDDRGSASRRCHAAWQAAVKRRGARRRRMAQSEQGWQATTRCEGRDSLAARRGTTDARRRRLARARISEDRRVCVCDIFHDCAGESLCDVNQINFLYFKLNSCFLV